jgi:hypothetical protein
MQNGSAGAELTLFLTKLMLHVHQSPTSLMCAYIVKVFLKYGKKIF